MIEVQDLASIEMRLTSRFMRESWKYTSLKKFRAALAEAGIPSPAKPDVTGADITPISEVEAEIAGAFWDRTVDLQRYPLAAISMNAKSGWFVHVAPSSRATIKLANAARGHEVIFVDIGQNAEVEIVDDRATDGVLTQVLAANVGADARLTHHQAALFHGGKTAGKEWRLTSVCLDRNASYTQNGFACGAELRRIDSHVRFMGDHAQADLAGAIAVADKGHLDQQIVVEHMALHGKSEQRFNAIANGRGKFTFNGRIHIHPGAIKTDASLTNRNLALDAGCEINTKPELEIYADDVQCAHGATIGKLADEELFYLRSRGLDLDTATGLLTRAFLFSHARGPLTQTALPVLLEAL